MKIAVALALALALVPASRAVAAEAPKAAAPAASTLVIPVKGMSCGGCAAHIDASLRKLDGVKSARTEVEKAQTTVQFDPAKVKPEQLAAAITKAGYEPGPAHAP